jgi:hypothetical protein
MKKILKKYGGSLVLAFSREEIQVYNLKEGIVLDVEIKKEGGENGKDSINNNDIQRKR